MGLKSKQEAEDAVQRGLELMLDGIDGLDEPEEFNPILSEAITQFSAAHAYFVANGEDAKASEVADHMAEAKNRMIEDWDREAEIEQRLKEAEDADIDTATHALNILADLQPTKALQTAQKAMARALASGDANAIAYEAERLAGRLFDKSHETRAIDLLEGTAARFLEQGEHAHAARMKRELADLKSCMVEEGDGNLAPVIALLEEALALALQAEDVNEQIYAHVELLDWRDKVGDKEGFEAAISELLRLEPIADPMVGMTAEIELRHWNRWKKRG